MPKNHTQKYVRNYGKTTKKRPAEEKYLLRSEDFCQLATTGKLGQSSDIKLCHLNI